MPLMITVPSFTDAARRAEMAEQCGFEHPYRHSLGAIDHAIGQLKRHRAAVQELAEHTHEWGENDYCRICGADGRA